MKKRVPPSHGPTRREFCAYAASLVAAGTLAACGGGSSPTSPSSSFSQLPSVQGTVNGRTISVNVAGGSPLASVGSAALVQTSLGSFLLSQTAQNSFTAVSAVCTHQGCLITGFSNNQYVCPCHGSQFTTSGGVVTGPAFVALPQYATQFSGGVVSFTV